MGGSNDDSLTTCSGRYFEQWRPKSALTNTNISEQLLNRWGQHVYRIRVSLQCHTKSDSEQRISFG